MVIFFYLDQWGIDFEYFLLFESPFKVDLLPIYTYRVRLFYFI